EYPWPGNVRELKNLMERTVLLEQGEELQASHFQLGSARPRGRREVASIGTRIDELLQGGPLPEEGLDFDELTQALEKALIVKANEAAHWNQSRAAELLHMKRDKLRYRMK